MRNMPSLEQTSACRVLASVLPTHLGAAAAHIHATPSAVPSLAPIKKEPSTPGTFLYLLPFFSRGQECYGRMRHRPEEQPQVLPMFIPRSPLPRERMCCREQRCVSHRLSKDALHQAQVLAPGHAPTRDCRKDAVDGLSQCDSALEGLERLLWMSAGL